MVTFPVSCLLTAGVSLQDEGDREIVRADSIAEARKRIEHDVATVREDSEPWRHAALHGLQRVRIHCHHDPPEFSSTSNPLR